MVPGFGLSLTPQLGVGLQPEATPRPWVPVWRCGQEGAWASSQAAPQKFGKATTCLAASPRTQWGRAE